MPPLKSYVRVDEHDVMRVGKTRVMLDSIVPSFEQGCSPETIQQQRHEPPQVPGGSRPE